MVIAIYLVLLFLVLVFLRSFKQKITWCFSCYLVGIFLLLTSTILYMAKFSFYDFFLSIDYSMYLLIGKIKIRVSDISRIYNWGIALILLVPMLLFRMLYQKKLLRDILLLIPPLFYLWYNDYATGERLHLMLQFSQNPERVEHLIRIGNGMSMGLIFLCMGLAMFCFLWKIREAKHFFDERENKVCLVCVSILNLFVCVFFIFGRLRYINPFYLTLLRYPNRMLEWNSYLMIPVVLMVVLVLILFVLWYFKPYHQLVIFRRDNIVSNNRKLDKSTRMIFHTYKNSFVAIAKLAELAQNHAEDRYDLVIEILGKIKDLSEVSVENISGIIDSLGDIKLQVKNISATQCIEEAIAKSGVPEGVSVKTEYKSADVMFHASRSHIVAMLANIIVNAVEAIRNSDIPDGEIRITYDCDGQYISIEIADNGPGIPHSELKNIFKPLFSNKSGSENFGLGLTYVEKVIKAHYGYINVISKVGEGTTFQLLLPMEEEKEKQPLWRRLK
ncbi:MAG: HAMP domain-containing histidine kinase [Ruminococcaceae bacterium]|nr:HAMP domain-containing histidine kinase [Oscillospiraceae bacterium]